MRLNFLRTIYFIGLTLVFLRLFYWQVLQSDYLSALADQQHLETLSIDAPRGTIKTSDGSVLATVRPAYSMYGLPKVIKDKGDIALQLSEIFLDSNITNPQQRLDQANQIKKDILDKINQDLYWVNIKNNLSFDQKEQIEVLKIEGLGFEKSLQRYYPESSASAHILGFVGSNSTGRSTGYFGIEGFYNRELSGSSGVLTQEKDALGVPILSGRFFKKEPVSGFSLNLTIDRSVQYVVEKQLKIDMEKYGAKSASVVVMDPQTGKIIAMAAYPNYDPENFNNFPKNYYKNPVVGDTYEPGSTFKVLVMSAGIHEGMVKPDTKCDICEGPLLVSGNLIRTWNNKYTKDSTMNDVIVHSDNTGMVFVSRKLGLDKMYDYIHKFGFGSLTGIDLQDEVSPDIRDKKFWREIDIATASFGQGIAVTPIQMVRAVSSIANGGRLMEPHIVESIEINNKKTIMKPKEIGRPISEEAAKLTTGMMVDAVDKGEAQFYKKKAGLSDYKIAGKTGTAQIPVAGHYDPNKTVASFVGFAPADNPKFVMLVKFDEPTSSIFGADTAAPTFFNIAKQLFVHYSITPAL